ncbi:STAS domain-containing protein [Microbaculum marinum]|uniref:Anti-sigma factor antagonist n=1 Tax=Microbaculum marinum TaxID=1764581 RepID=A0AAW9RH88_9HYPH
MDIREEQLDGVSIVVPVGRIDINTAPEAEAAIMPKFDEARGVVVDFAELTYISSAGLRILLKAAKRSKASGVPLAFSNMAPPVLEVFEVSGFARLFSIYGDRAAAVASIPAA